jgi:hypothetical protein
MFVAGKLEKRHIVSVTYLLLFDEISIDFTRLTESLNIHCKIPCKFGREIENSA